MTMREPTSPGAVRRIQSILSLGLDMRPEPHRLVILHRLLLGTMHPRKRELPPSGTTEGRDQADDIHRSDSGYSTSDFHGQRTCVGRK